MIGGTPNGQTGSNVNYCYTYDPAADAWNTGLANMPTARGWIQGAYWDYRLYVMGGYSNSGGGLANNEIYDIAGDAWSTGTSVPQTRLAHGTAAYNASVYVVGGLNPGLTAGTQTVYRYDIAGDSWTQATQLPQEYDMGGVATWQNNIYICGGLNRTQSQAYTNVYQGVINPSDPDDITWNTLGALPTPNCINAAATLQGNVYMLGGFQNLTTVTSEAWEYDPVGDSWLQLPNYPVAIARNHYMVGRWGSGELYAVAGDANGDWAEPNNEYNKLYLFGVAEQTDPLEPSQVDFSLTPNVGGRTTRIAFTLGVTRPVTITLYNSLGQKVQSVFNSSSVKTHSLTLPLSELPAGVYFVNLDAGSLTRTEKLVVTR
jgi:hypothetical protein